MGRRSRRRGDHAISDLAARTVWNHSSRPGSARGVEAVSRADEPAEGRVHRQREEPGVEAGAGELAWIVAISDHSDSATIPSGC